MIILAITATVAAVLWSMTVVGANGMRSSPGSFQGGSTIFVAWVGVVLLWLAWWVG